MNHQTFKQFITLKSPLLPKLCGGALSMCIAFAIAAGLGCASTGSTPQANGDGQGGEQSGTQVTGRDKGASSKVEATRPPYRRPTPLEMEEAAASRSPLKGATAPLFTLVNQDEKPVALENLRGKWTILYFYPKDDTPGCTCQATEFTDILRRFHMLNAQVYGVSPDNPSSHRFFISKYKLNLPLLSDTDHKVMTAYGSWVPFKVGAISGHRVVRSTFLIDPKGKIAWHWPEVIPEGHAARVRDKLVALQGKPAGS